MSRRRRHDADTRRQELRDMRADLARRRAAAAPPNADYLKAKAALLDMLR